MIDIKRGENLVKALYSQRFVFVLSIAFLGTTLLYSAWVQVCIYRGGGESPLICKSPEHDFGEILRTDSPEHRFVLVNCGSKPVLIRYVAPGCGSCIYVVDYTRTPILPDGEGFVTLQLLAGLEEGRVSKVAIVMPDVPRVPALLLTLKAKILPSNNGKTEGKSEE